MMSQPQVRFAAIGLNHGHVYGQTDILLSAGAQLASFYAPEPELAAQYGKRYPQAVQVSDEREILEDESIHLIISAGIPCERASLGITVMRHGKDYMSDKPAFTTFEQLAAARRVQAETGCIYSICYSERLLNRSTVRAGELVQMGAIGRVLQTVSLGPHLRRFHTRPEWFFQREKFGGIITDIGSHNFDQFLYFTGSTSAEIVASQVANYHHPQYPEFEDFGDVMVRGDDCTGYLRVDWFTPDGLGVWGDGRLTVLGTEGYIELRKYVDIGGRSGGDHLFLVDREGIQYIPCQDVDRPYGRQLLYDIIHRTETAMSQEHAFLAMELALTAQSQASRLGHLEARRG